MAIAIEATEILAERWAKNSDAKARKVLRTGGTHAQIAHALACIPFGAYSLARRNGRALSLTLPGDLCELLGLNAGERIVYFVTDRGTAEFRRATLDDLPAYARPAAAVADALLAERRPQMLLNHFERYCHTCDKLYCARSPVSRFCAICRRSRQRAQWRDYWHRKGKLTPSYRRKLKGRRGALAEPSAPTATDRTETNSQGMLACR